MGNRSSSTTTFDGKYLAVNGKNRVTFSPRNCAVISKVSNGKPTKDNLDHATGVFFSESDTHLVISNVTVDQKYLEEITLEARTRQAQFKRVEFLSCTVGGDFQNRFPSALVLFLEVYAPALETLKVTGPMLLETNQQACELLQSILDREEQTLKRLTICVGQTANSTLCTNLGKVLRRLSLKFLSLEGLSLKNVEAFSILARFVAHSTSLQALDLSNCRMGNDCFHTLVEAIGQAPASVPLDTILLKNNGLTSACWCDLTQFCELVKPTLQRLALSNMPLLFATSDESLRAFNVVLQVMMKNGRIKELLLADTGMSQEKMVLLFSHVTNMEDSSPFSVEKLNISCNEISQEETLRLLALYLPRLHPKLETLYMLNKDDTTDCCQSLLYVASQHELRTFFSYPATVLSQVLHRRLVSMAAASSS